MGSSRLPGKVLKEVLGYPLIILNLKRLAKSKKIDKLILATSDSGADDILYEAVRAAGYEVFRGDEDNVLKRYRDCVLEYGGEIIVRVTGDCPLITVPVYFQCTALDRVVYKNRYDSAFSI